MSNPITLPGAGGSEEVSRLVTLIHGPKGVPPLHQNRRLIGSNGGGEGVGVGVPITVSFFLPSVGCLSSTAHIATRHVSANGLYRDLRPDKYMYELILSSLHVTVLRTVVWPL